VLLERTGPERSQEKEEAPVASIYPNAAGIWRIRFRFWKTQFFRSLETRSKTEAERVKRDVEETIDLLKRGRIKLPEKATKDDVAAFIMSGGRITSDPGKVITNDKTLKDVTAAYFSELPANAKAQNTLYTEKIHVSHLERLFRPTRRLQDIDIQELQRYVNKRSQEAGQRGKNVQPETITKELATLRQIWKFAQDREWVTEDLRLDKVVLPKAEGERRYFTMDEIQRTIQRGGLTEDEVQSLWSCLFLRESEVLELLSHVEKNAAYSFVYPMVAFAALSGARRSEILCSEVDDICFERKCVVIRERKRKKQMKVSFRYVQMGKRLEQTMKSWLDMHPGGRYTISRTAGEPLTEDAASYHFNKVLADSKWSVVQGFHVLRHSFASICAMHGVPESIVSAWMGHMTESMRAHYRHLYPEQAEQAMAGLFNVELFG
jgi:site-specific recombinase XerD